MTQLGNATYFGKVQLYARDQRYYSSYIFNYLDSCSMLIVANISVAIKITLKKCII